jgi:PiT family inorganic phosphate transporter
VPVSGSQAVVGAVMGIGLAKGGRNVNYKLLGKIGMGWVLTPLIALVVSYIALFFMQNVFMHQVFQ